MARETTTVKDRAGNDVLIYKDEEHNYAEWNKPKAKPDAHTLYDGEGTPETVDAPPKKGTAAWYKAELTEAGVEFADDAVKKDLKVLLDAHQAAK